MVYFFLSVITSLIMGVIFLFREVHQQKIALSKVRTQLENRTEEASDLRAALNRRKVTHVRNLEDHARHYEKRLAEETRRVSLEWTATVEGLHQKYRNELRQQAEEIRAHYEKQVLALQEAHREHNRLLIGHVEDLIEPIATGDCLKVRCHDDEEGKLWARKFEADRNFPEGSFDIYRCKICPRNPIYGTRYVHIFTSDPDLKRVMKETPNFTLVHPSQRLFARFNPADLANLRKKVRGE